MRLRGDVPLPARNSRDLPVRSLLFSANRRAAAREAGGRICAARRDGKPGMICRIVPGGMRQAIIYGAAPEGVMAYTAEAASSVRETADFPPWPRLCLPCPPEASSDAGPALLSTIAPLTASI